MYRASVEHGATDRRSVDSSRKTNDPSQPTNARCRRQLIVHNTPVCPNAGMFSSSHRRHKRAAERGRSKRPPAVASKPQKRGRHTSRALSGLLAHSPHARPRPLFPGDSAATVVSGPAAREIGWRPPSTCVARMRAVQSSSRGGCVAGQRASKAAGGARETRLQRPGPRITADSLGEQLRSHVPS